MVNLTGQPPVAVRFRGDRAAEGPLTLGQRNILQWLQTAPDHIYASLEWTYEIPDGTSLRDVVETFAVLLARHEGLRTTYLTGTPPAQRVCQEGVLPLEVYAVDEAQPGPVGGAVAAAELSRLLAVGPPLCTDPGTGPGAGLPMRVAVATVGDAVHACVVRYSHLTVDFQAMAVLAREFAELIHDPALRCPGAARHQPLHRAEVEREAGTQRRMVAATRYWERHLKRMPQSVYPAGCGGPPGSGALVLASPAAARALPHLAVRTRTSRPTVVLAALCAALAERTGHRACHFPILSGNRFEPTLAEYVGTLVQATLFAVNVTEVSFDGLVRRAFAGMLDASRFGLYDAFETARIRERLQRERGVVLHLEPLFNNLVVESEPAATEPLPEIAGAPPASLRWRSMPPSPTPLRFELWQLDGELQIQAWSGDTGRIPRADVESLLLAVERLLVAAAGADLDQAGMRAAMRLRPVPRGADWLLVDGCWIELGEVQRLLDDALPGSTARACSTGEAPVVAYLSAGPSAATPQQAHARCMEALPGRLTAMAPGHYVVCAGAPADPADRAGWLRMPVLAQGSGRDPAE
jgi:Condensation domain